MSVIHQGFERWYSTETGVTYDSVEACRHYDDQFKRQRLAGASASQPLIMGVGPSGERPITSFDDLPAEAVRQLGEQLRAAAFEAEGKLDLDRDIDAVMQKHPDYLNDNSQEAIVNAAKVHGYLAARGRNEQPNAYDIDEAITELKAADMLILKRIPEELKQSDESATRAELEAMVDAQLRRGREGF